MGILMAGAAMTSAYAKNGPEPDKPIMYMTPAELFSNPQLRQLAVAAQKGRVKKIDALIAAGVNVNGKGKYGITPLFSAVQVGNKKGFDALLNHGADPNVIGTDGYTLMNQIACCSPVPYFMEMALKHGANPNLVEPATGKTPLIAAVTVTGKVNIPPLIKAGANLNYETPVEKTTAMMDAVLDGQFDVVYELLEAGADYGLRDYRGKGNRGWNLENYIKFSFRANVSPEQRQSRNRVIEFLKQHNAWSGEAVKWTPDFRQ